MTTNLSGSLSEFSLAEVLSLLGMGGRTAHMQVTSPDSVGTVHLVDGRISSATADSARAGLLRAVVAAVSVPADDLAHALQSEDPVRALVESGVVDREAAQQVASEHCTRSCRRDARLDLGGVRRVGRVTGPGGHRCAPRR